jgi:DNA topoisomerase-1
VGYLTVADNKKVEKFSYTSEEQVNTLLEDARGRSYRVTGVEKKTTKTRPYPPYITSTLQQDAARRLYFNARQTMQLAQQLYEGITIGKKGQTGLITYMRTDSVNMSQKAVMAGREEIENLFGADYLTDKPRNFSSKSQNAQEAHEAIRPTYPSLTPQDVKPYLNNQQFKLYDLIWRRFMATQMKEAQFNAQTVTVEDEEKTYTFTAKGSVMKFDGFMASYPVRTTDTYLPEVQEGEPLSTTEITGHQHFTQPPGRYTESTLVKMLEKYEIGRPSTYATIIATIEDRGYVQKNDQKRFSPTDTGRIVNDMLVTHFPNIVDTDFTANLENQLDEVAEGKESYAEMLRQFYEPFMSHLEDREEKVDKYAYILPDRSCPKCGANVELKLGKYGKFIACTQYPECDFKDQTDEEKEFNKQFAGETCPECGAEMQVRRGRYGPFLGCSRYPECKGMKKIEYKVGKTCPECGEGELVVKKSKKGRQFHACNRYPDCKYAENPKN